MESVDSEIKDNIIEAIRSQQPNHVLLKCLDQTGFAMRHQNFMALLMPDGTVGVFNNGFSSMYYRGESGDYPSCKASLYRIADQKKQVISLIKTYEFQQYLETTIEVQKWKEDNKYLDLWALSQHYGFATPMIDVTFEIGVAAFFATHDFDYRINQYVLKKEGIGALRCYCGVSMLDGPLHPIGMQPFSRPASQDGAALWIGDNDLAGVSYKIKFKQDAEINNRLERAMLLGSDMLFPFEPSIVEAANVIKNSDVVTSMAIKKFLENGTSYLPEAKYDENSLESLLKENHISIVDAPLADGHFRSILGSRIFETSRVYIRKPAIDKFLNESTEHK